MKEVLVTQYEHKYVHAAGDKWRNELEGLGREGFHIAGTIHEPDGTSTLILERAKKVVRPNTVSGMLMP